LASTPTPKALTLGEFGLNHLLEIVVADDAFDALDGLASLEEHARRQRIDLEAARDVGVLFRVDLDHHQLPAGTEKSQRGVRLAWLGAQRHRISSDSTRARGER
jgi:hypothetical protein